MYRLLVSSIIEAVRKNLDEVGLNESAMYPIEGFSGDNDSLDSVIKKTIPESINKIVSVSAHKYLDGEDITNGDLSVDGHVAFTVNDDKSVLLEREDIDMLRLVAFKLKDSPILLTDYVEEGSPEARMQGNKYIRGAYDKPVLVRLWRKGGVAFMYYSLNPETSITAEHNIEVFLVYQRQRYLPNTTSYEVPIALVDAIINQVTADVMVIFNLTDKASYYADIAIRACAA